MKLIDLFNKYPESAIAGMVWSDSKRLADIANQIKITYLNECGFSEFYQGDCYLLALWYMGGIRKGMCLSPYYISNFVLESDVLEYLRIESLRCRFTTNERLSFSTMIDKFYEWELEKQGSRVQHECTN